MWTIVYQSSIDNYQDLEDWEAWEYFDLLRSLALWEHFNKQSIRPIHPPKLIVLIKNGYWQKRIRCNRHGIGLRIKG